MANEQVPISLGLQLRVTNGRNQIQRNSGDYAALYLVPGSRIAENYIELAPNEVYSSNPGESSSNLVLSTNTPLVLVADLASGGQVTLQVNKMLVLDTALSGFTITNPGTNRARVQMNAVNYTSLAPAEGIYYGTSIKPGVYNQAFIETLTKTVGPKNQTFVVDALANQFIYYAYPVLQGQSQFEVNGFVGGITLVSVVNFVTPQGPMQYYIYESDNPGLGATTVTVTGV